MSTTTEDKWVCPECNVEMISIGRREMKVPMIGENGMNECAFYPTQFRCPVCQTMAYDGAELIDQLRARQKKGMACQVWEISKRAIDASNRLHNRHNRIRGLWGIAAFLCGAAISIAHTSGYSISWWVYAMPLIAIYSIFERKNFATNEVWDEVPDQESKASDESGVM